MARRISTVSEAVRFRASKIPRKTEYDKIAGTSESDFQYAGYYDHSRSGLKLTLNRAYKADLGRWLNRDPIREAGGLNLFAYVANNPTLFIDPTGLQAGWKPLTSNDFSSGLRAELEAICCRCYNTEAEKADCKNLARTLGRDLQSLWNENYGKPGNPFAREKENAGGFMCYDWAAAFLRVVGTTGKLTGSIVEFNKAQEGNTIPQHYAVKISAGTSGSSKCRVMIDDGFLGDGMVHGANGTLWNTGKYIYTGNNRFDKRLPHIPGSMGPPYVKK